MGEEPASYYRLQSMVQDALIDARSVLQSITIDEMRRVKEDPIWAYMNDEVLIDPFEAFHFNVIEEVTTDYIKSLDSDIWVAPKGFNMAAMPFIQILYHY